MEGQDWTTTNVGRGTVGGAKALPKTKTAMVSPGESSPMLDDVPLSTIGLSFSSRAL